MSEAWNKHDRACPPCPDCGTELYEKFWGNGGWAKTEIATDRGHGPDDCVKRLKHPLESIQLKPRTTVARFASSLKSRIERAAIAFEQPGQDGMVAGMRYVLGIIDAALSDYDVRAPPGGA